MLRGVDSSVRLPKFGGGGAHAKDQQNPPTPCPCDKVVRRVRTIVCPLPVSLPPEAPEPSSLCSATGPALDSALSFLSFETLSSFKALLKPLRSRF